MISMLEELLSGKNVVEKKRILADEYGMRMTTELEGRIRIMCNLSENIEERRVFMTAMKQKAIDMIRQNDLKFN